MIFPEILNRREFSGRLPPNTVLIDRTTIWGNPFHLGIDGDRDEVLEKYLSWLPTQPQLIAKLPLLHGRNLMCWCSPKRCHGEVLRLLAWWQFTHGRSYALH